MNGNKSKSARELTKDEAKFHSEWMGSLIVVESLEDVISVVRALER